MNLYTPQLHVLWLEYKYVILGQTETGQNDSCTCKLTLLHATAEQLVKGHACDTISMEIHTDWTSLDGSKG